MLVSCTVTMQLICAFVLAYIQSFDFLKMLFFTLQVQQLQGRRRLSINRCNSMSDESTDLQQSESHMNLTQPCSSQPVRSTSDQPVTTEKGKLKVMVYLTLNVVVRLGLGSLTDSFTKLKNPFDHVL